MPAIPGKKPFQLFIVTVLATLILTGLTGVSSATPSSGVSAKERELAALSNQLERMNDRLGMLVEDYNSAKVRLENTRDKLTKTRSELNVAERDLDRSTKIFRQRLVDIYQTDAISILNVVLGSTSFTDLVVRIDMYSRLARSDADTVGHIKDVKAEVERKKSELEAMAKRQSLDAMIIERKKAAVRAETVAQERQLASKKTQLAQLRAREAAEAARLRREALARAQAATQFASSRSSAPRNRTASAGAAPVVNIPAPAPGDSGRASRLISISTKYLGIRYVWAGSTPSSGFDCSGFTSYVYRQIGISLPHSSRAQATMGRQVPLNSLQPGDLVFRGSPIHHVGIYIGGGRMIHSPQSGDVVKISPIRSLVRAVRLL